MRQGDGHDDDVARIEHAIAELWRLAASPRLHEDRMRSLGVTLSRTEMRFLGQIDQRGPLSVSKLAAAVGVSQPTASRALRRLERDGMVRRRSDGSDGRVAIYELTARGRRVWARLQRLMHDQLSAALAHVSARRRRDMAARLEELVATMRGADRSPALRLAR